MARPTPYLFCRYEIADENGPLSATEQLQALRAARGKLIAYRKREPTPLDEDTFLLKPKQTEIDGHAVLTWEVAQELRTRERTRYDRDRDETLDEAVETDEIRSTRFLALPELSVAAVDDRISERTLGAKSAISRFQAIFAQLTSYEVRMVFAGTPQDVQRALDSWTLDKFSFTVRPFNPTPSKLGERLDELMKSDHVGVMRAIALPDQSGGMRDSHHGLIAEARGLSDAGYGQIGATGTTTNGLRASLSQPKFTPDKAKNLERQAQNRTMKVYVEAAASLEEEQKALVKSLLDLYG